MEETGACDQEEDICKYQELMDPIVVIKLRYIGSRFNLTAPTLY